MNGKEFKSLNDWHGFCGYLTRSNRYVLNKRWSDFLNTILHTVEKRVEVHEEKFTLFRARIGDNEVKYKDEYGDEDSHHEPFSKEEDIGAPPPKKARGGRINPRGISVLYLSNNIETAISEVRPCLNQNVTIGIFILKSGLKIINTTKDKENFNLYLKNRPLTPDEKAKHIWFRINNSFSEPVRPGDEDIKYIPTQYLSEFFKTNGYDGIAYKSALNEDGYNLVLFDPTNATLKKTKLFKIESIKHTYNKTRWSSYM
jgi:hypothetical protein